MLTNGGICAMLLSQHVDLEEKESTMRGAPVMPP